MKLAEVWSRMAQAIQERIGAGSHHRKSNPVWEVGRVVTDQVAEWAAWVPLLPSRLGQKTIQQCECLLRFMTNGPMLICANPLVLSELSWH